VQHCKSLYQLPLRLDFVGFYCFRQKRAARLAARLLNTSNELTTALKMRPHSGLRMRGCDFRRRCRKSLNPAIASGITAARATDRTSCHNERNARIISSLNAVYWLREPCTQLPWADRKRVKTLPTSKVFSWNRQMYTNTKILPYCTFNGSHFS